MDRTDRTLEKLHEDTELSSKRKLLLIISVLLIAMSVSGANLVEVNTFIFKVNFSNTLGFSLMFFIGVLILILRYYSVANPYHAQLYDLWANDMMRDPRVLGYHIDGNEFFPHGLLSDKKEFSYPLMIEETDHVRMTPEYVVKGVFKRSVRLYEDYDEGSIAKDINLLRFDKEWTFGHYIRLLKFEFSFQCSALFRRTESLEIMLPYIISISSLLSFIFKSEIQAYLQ